MNVPVADERLAVTDRPPFRGTIEIHRGGEHRIVFDGVEQTAIAIQQAPQTASRWKKRVRRNDESTLTLLQSREIVERVNLLCAATEVEEQDMPALDGPLDARDQHNAALGRIGKQASQIELALVQRDRERVVSKRSHSID